MRLVWSDVERTVSLPKAPLHSLGLETETFFRSEGSEPGSSLRAELTVVATNMQAQTLSIAVGDVLTAYCRDNAQGAAVPKPKAERIHFSGSALRC